MSAPANPIHELFDVTLPLCLERLFGFVRPDRLLVSPRAVPALVTGWLPMTVLAAAQLQTSSQESAKFFLSDLPFFFAERERADDDKSLFQPAGGQRTTSTKSRRSL